MSIYTPDKWVVVKLTNKQYEVHYRIFACWYGGWSGADSWQMNSGITKANLVDDFYEFSGTSGSLYMCHNNVYGTSLYGHGVLTNMIKNFKYLTVEVMPEDTDFLKLEYKNEQIRRTHDETND